MIRAGVIGAGAIGRLHADAYGALAHAGRAVRLVAIADSDVDRARRLAAELDAGVAAEDVAGLLARADVDAVSVCAPTAAHAELARACARAGKHVLVEKPVALGADDADALTAACAEAGVLLMVGHSARFDAVNLQLRALVDDGSIGAPVLLSTFARHGWFWPGGWRGWQLDPAASGGHFVHNAVHEIDLACWLFGSAPARVYARGMRIASPALDTYDAYTLQLSFASGATLLAALDCAAVPHTALLRSVQLIGSAGEAGHDTTEDGFVWTGAGVGHVALAFDGSIERELAHWLDCLEGTAEPAATGADAARALRVALAAELSARTGEAVALDG